MKQLSPLSIPFLFLSVLFIFISCIPEERLACMFVYYSREPTTYPGAHPSVNKKPRGTMLKIKMCPQVPSPQVRIVFFKFNHMEKFISGYYQNYKPVFSLEGLKLKLQ